MSHFPNCEILGMDQRTEEWHLARKGMLTASRVGSWIAELPSCRETVQQLKNRLEEASADFLKSSTRPNLIVFCEKAGIVLPLANSESTIKARTSAIAKAISSHADCDVPDEWEVDPDGPPPRNPSLWAVWNGIRMETEAEEAFTEATGLELKKVGFCKHSSGVCGVSPDGLVVGQNVGFEGKAPLPQTHVKYLLNDVLPDEYRDQVHFSMAVTGADAWWFQSYCAGLPNFRILVKRDEYTEAMVAGIEVYKEHLAAAYDFVSNYKSKSPAVEMEGVA